MIQPKKEFMQEAIKQAVSSRDAGDYAVGAVLVQGDKIIAASSNRSRRDQSPVAHAEALVIIEGSKILKNRHLADCILYATHEPCPMCASLIVWAKIKGVVYGAEIADMKKYQTEHPSQDYLWRTIDIPMEEIIKKSPEKVEVVKNFMWNECVELFHS